MGGTKRQGARQRAGWVAAALTSLLVACGNPSATDGPRPLNSTTNDEEPALSGDGRLLTWVSNRNGRFEILLYDLDRRRYLELPQAVPGNRAYVASPSLSRTGRYLVYLLGDRGRPEIVLYDRVTQERQFLTRSSREWIRNPNVSPNGRYVVFETARRGQWDVEVLDRGPDVEPDIADGTPVEAPERSLPE